MSPQLSRNVQTRRRAFESPIRCCLQSRNVSRACGHLRYLSTMKLRYSMYFSGVFRGLLPLKNSTLAFRSISWIEAMRNQCAYMGILTCASAAGACMHDAPRQGVSCPRSGLPMCHREVTWNGLRFYLAKRDRKLKQGVGVCGCEWQRSCCSYSVSQKTVFNLLACHLHCMRVRCYVALPPTEHWVSRTI
jgi:hypothetical protein